MASALELSELVADAVLGVDTAAAAVTPLTGITPDEGALALGATNADGSAKTLLVHVADGGGTLETVTVSGATLTADTVLATGSIGAGIVGPDGCFYIGGQHSVYKLTPTSGNCGLTPTTLGPTLTLSPATLTSNPIQGGTQAFTATLKGAAAVSGIPVYFLARGANTALQQVVTDSNGVASWTYTGRAAGIDKVYAATSVPGASTATQEQLTSNTVQVTWNTGTHATSLTLNLSPSSGTANTQTSVTANLTDTAVSPVVALAGQSVSFTLGAASCTAVTDSNGNATCQLALPNAGSSTLSASFAGSSQEAASTASIAFNVAQAASADFTITASPNSLTTAAGQSVESTLTITPSSGFSQAVSFTCAGLPTGATCNFSPATVTPGSGPVTTKVTIATTSRSAMTGIAGGGTTLVAGLLFMAARRRNG